METLFADVPVDASRQPVVLVKDGVVFTNSRDVAAFFDKEHRDVLRAIDNLLGQEPDLRLRNFAQTSKTVGMPNGGTREERTFDMNRDGFTLLAMGFTGGKALKWKLRYIEAFNTMEAELRARPAVDPMKALNDPATMRGLLLSYSEKVLELETENAELAPKAEALDRIAKADGSLCITDAAKTLQMAPKELFRYLRANRWTYSRPGTADIGYQSHIASGDLEHKVTTVLRSDGTEKAATQVRVTPQGLAKLAKLMRRSVQAA